MSFNAYFLAGGAGFIGSHFIDALLQQKHIQKVTIYDNFTSGKEWHYAHHQQDPRLSVIKADVKDAEQLTQAMKGHDAIIHFASNPDIALAATNPGIDFIEGIYLTYQIIEAARLNQVKRLIYISGSGVYGDVGKLPSREDVISMLPISTYGASKIGGEAFVASYCHMFGLTACIFRFGNVVGPRQTHGVGYDFVNKLLQDPSRLGILGDGTQSKSYVHVDDIVAAVLLANEKMQNKYEIYNVDSGDYITVTEIAEIAIKCMEIKAPVNLEYTGGDRGWKGDVPIVRLNTDKIQSLGWVCKRNSTQAMQDSILALIQQAKHQQLAMA
ncbi:MAG: NAD-dependent epimerase/dehydratase family protein [Pseudomonadota bacterium]